jgi:predicted nucleic acid-binding protein
MRVFLDVNIFMYAAGRPHAYQAPSASLLDQVVAGAVEAVTNTEVLQEVLHRFWRMSALPDGLVLCDRIVQIVDTILPIEKSDLLLTRRLLEAHRQIEPRDAVHAAVMLNHGITHLYSHDRHFDLLTDLTRLEPST